MRTIAILSVRLSVCLSVRLSLRHVSVLDEIQIIVFFHHTRLHRDVESNAESGSTASSLYRPTQTEVECSSKFDLSDV